MKTIKLNKENFEQTINQSSAPVLVDFWAEWCGPCKMLNPLLEEIASETGERATIAKVNIDEEPELAQRYGVQSIPTLIVFRGGQPQDQLVGVRPKRAILEKLQLN